MPFIKVKKPGIFGEAFLGEKAYEVVEVDETGQPIRQKQAWTPKQEFWNKQEQSVGKMSRPYAKRKVGRPYEGGTEPVIEPGVRAPDKKKGYTKPFNYELWNRLRALKKKKK